jgi:hypothetical protein
MIDIAFRVARQDWAGARRGRGQVRRRQGHRGDADRAARPPARELETASSTCASSATCPALGARDRRERPAQGDRELEDARLDIERRSPRSAWPSARRSRRSASRAAPLDAAQMLAKKARMLKTIARARQEVERWQRQAAPLLARDRRDADLYRAFPASPAAARASTRRRVPALARRDGARERGDRWRAGRRTSRRQAEAQARCGCSPDPATRACCAHSIACPRCCRRARESLTPAGGPADPGREFLRRPCGKARSPAAPRGGPGPVAPYNQPVASSP